MDGEHRLWICLRLSRALVLYLHQEHYINYFIRICISILILEKSRKIEVVNACADTAFKYASPEHTGRTGNSVDLRSDVSFFLFSLLLLFYLFF